jgi:P4 family phage/plasmid primase-like protien
MIQILGIRKKEDGKTYQAFEDRHWAAPTVSDLFENPGTVLAQVPQEERYNLYFTVHNCAGVTARDFTEQWFMPFDIDGCDEDSRELVFDAFCDVLHVSKQKTLATWSGNGMQFFIELEEPIKDKQYFDIHRPVYKIICEMLKKELSERGLKGVPDPSVFSYRRLMRLPETLNVKPHGKRKAYVVQKHAEPQGWNFSKAVAIPGVDERGAIPLREFNTYPKPDVETVQAECEFLKWAKASPNELSEEQWYAMLGIIGHLPGGRSLAHEYSRGYKGYSEAETTFKTEHAIAASGPRTCANVRTLSDKCLDCKHFGTGLRSPISIKGENYILSEGDGFYKTIIAANGAEKIIPQYEDLVKYFNKKVGKSANTPLGLFVYDADEKIWTVRDEVVVRNFFYTAMNPKPRSSIVEEAFKTLNNYRAVPIDFFDRAKRMVNLRNGVLDIKTRSLLPHSPDYGFRNVLSYDYDKGADCPTFKAFLEEIMCGDRDLVSIIQEFMGYIISGDDCWLHKALIFIGEGSNGKSTLNQVLLAMVGEKNCSKVPLSRFNDPQFLYQLDGALVNLADENSPDALLNSDTFKEAVSGGYINVKKLYSQPYPIKNKAKFIFNCNSMPISKDKTMGLYRRMLFVPFDKVFTEETADVFIAEKLLKELPGILNFALEGYDRLLEKKKFTHSVQSEDILENFKEAQNDVEQWINECLHVSSDKDSFVASSELYKHYQEWCEENRKRYITNYVEFGFKLRKFAATNKVKAGKRRIEGNTNQSRGYVGLKLVEKEELF